MVQYRQGASYLTVLYRQGASYLTVLYRQLITTIFKNNYLMFDPGPVVSLAVTTAT